MQNGVIRLNRPNRAIPAQVAVNLFLLENIVGWSRARCIEYERRRLVPPGHQPHPFRRNCEETMLDQLRTIVATYMFRQVLGSFMVLIPFSMLLS